MVYLCPHTHLLYILDQTLLEVTQEIQNRDTNKMVARVKYPWVLATILAMDLGVG